jgi:hypothetical protein
MAPKWYKYILLINSLFPFLVYSQNGSIRGLFLKIDTEPQIILCKNELEVNNQGGHLQGVQLQVKDDAEYAIISGSSENYAYYAVVKLDNYKEVLSVNILMHKPFKHAGGMQIFQDLMVIGIEDNTAKDKSKVCIYDLIDPETPPVKPLAMFTRKGEPFRSSAGCCGLTRIGNGYLVVVGDWDTKHLDFYLFDEHKFEQDFNALDPLYTLDTEKMDRSGWSDIEWHPYQNINLLQDADGRSYLVGFGQNDQNENIADLFLVENKDLKEFRLKKLLSKTFNCKQGADFRSGAGISLQPDGKLKIISCASHIKDSLILNVFD